MSNDMRGLFEVAGREMRPEFRERLVALARDELFGTPIDTDAESPDTDAEPPGSLESPEAAEVVNFDEFADVTVVSVQPTSAEHRGHRHPAAWLGVAASLLVVVALVAVVRGPGDSGRAQLSTATTLVPDARCLTAEPLGVVATMTGNLRIQMLDDGWSFCVIDLTTGQPVVAGTGGAVLAGNQPAPVQDAAVIESGMLTQTAAYYVIAVPEAMPVASVQGPNASAKSFPSRVGRRLLVIDTDFDPDATPSHEAHQLNLVSASRVLLATLTADVSS